MNRERIDPAVTYLDVSVEMERDSLDDFPHYDLPVGYTFRTYRPGDELIWTELHRVADLYAPDDALFEQQFGSNRAALADRMFFVENEAGETVASISAWWEHDHPVPNDRGHIHWVVVHPAHQQRGLAKAMMSRAMQRLAQDHRAAMLGTSSARPWAIKVYLDFGFHPVLTDLQKPETLAAWRDVQGILHHPELARWLNSIKIDAR
jgi:ribosomal protein S18 acetylase RimI-like enzyme